MIRLGTPATSTTEPRIFILGCDPAVRAANAIEAFDASRVVGDEHPQAVRLRALVELHLKEGAEGLRAALTDAEKLGPDALTEAAADELLEAVEAERARVKASHERHLALLRYTQTGDVPDHLVVPTGATEFIVCALEKNELKAARTAAGLVPHRGKRLWSRLQQAIVKRLDAEQLEAVAAARVVDVDVAADVQDRFLDELGPKDRAELEAFAGAGDEPGWLDRYHLEVCRRALVEVRGLPLERGEDGFPVERLRAGVDAYFEEFARTADDPALRRAAAGIDGGTVLEEIAGHALRLGDLGKGGWPCSAPPCGAGATATPSDGSASSAPSCPGSDAPGATAAAASPTAAQVSQTSGFVGRAG